MIPAAFRFLNNHKSTICGVVCAIGSTTPSLIALSVSGDDNTAVIKSSASFVTTPVITFLLVSNTVSGLASPTISSSWRMFSEQRNAFRSGLQEWPHLAERHVWKVGTGLGGRMGSVTGLVVHGLTFLLLAVGTGLAGDKKGAQRILPECALYSPMIFPIMCAGVGMVGGFGVARLATSRLLWG